MVQRRGLIANTIRTVAILARAVEQVFTVARRREGLRHRNAGDDRKHGCRHARTDKLLHGLKSAPKPRRFARNSWRILTLFRPQPQMVRRRMRASPGAAGVNLP